MKTLNPNNGGYLKNSKNMDKVCKKCAYWTKNQKDSYYKCYTSLCPAKIRDAKNK